MRHSRASSITDIRANTDTRKGGGVGSSPSRSHLRDKVTAHEFSAGAIFNQHTPASRCNSGSHRSGHEGGR